MRFYSIPVFTPFVLIRSKAFSSTIKLLLNGRDLGEQKVDQYRMNFFTVPYGTGKLEAIGFNGDKEVTRAIVETTSLYLEPNKSNIRII